MHTLLLLLAAALPLAAEMRTDVEFAVAGDVHLTLDAWVPEGKGPFAAVIVVHGGGFTNGDKQTYVKPLFEPLTQGGFAWFTINYRLAPQYHFPAAVEDVERAVEYVKSHAREYRVDPKRIALMGESAGGHLVSFVGAQNKRASRVAAVVSFYGPHDLETRAVQSKALRDSEKAFLGLTELNDETLRALREASPITYVKKGMPPFLLIHGTEDKAVPYDQSVRMCEKMKQAGNRCEIFTVEGAPHGVGPWEKNRAFQAYKEKMVAWLKQTLSGR
ncbi:MAG: alpha/beta hydrolase [Acidobacteria bacterium]|nr:alpha/beta hydrolase [Acidobacteriota bacterium]